MIKGLEPIHLSQNGFAYMSVVRLWVVRLWAP